MLIGDLQNYLKLNKYYSFLRTRGLSCLVNKLKISLFKPKAASFTITASLIKDKAGLEIGGPSPIFSDHGLLPVYPLVSMLDNCNFSSKTVWEGGIKEGRNFLYHRSKPLGHQFIAEATDLSRIASDKYDFILSSHAIEHSANPILALKEWIRVLKDGGSLILIVPHKEGTFDHRRPVVTLEHLIKDYSEGTGEDDLTHLDEILQYHDLVRDPLAGSYEAFKERSLKNFENRCLHQHAFDTRVVIELLDYVGLQIQEVEGCLPYHIIVVATKLPADCRKDNSPYKYPNSKYLKGSPFAADR